MMANKLKLFNEFSPLVLVPYLVVILFVFSYFVYQKYQVRIRIRNVPYSTIFNIDLDKVKKNLEIESMVYNFILVLLVSEIVANILWGISQFMDAEPYLFHYSVKNVSNNVTNRTHFHLTLGIHQSIIPLINNLPSIIMSSMLPVMCLFLIVLRRVFINLPYK